MNTKISKFINTLVISDYKYTVKRFKRTFGYRPNLHNPKTFNEKLNWRKLYDHKPIYQCFADKIESKKYVKNICGNKIIPKVLQIIDRSEDIDYLKLPESFIIKATHGSGWNKIVFDKEKTNPLEIANYFDKILKQNYYQEGREWCYKNLKPKLIIEELLTEEGKTPIDYKFFCFLGKVKFIQLDFDRYENHTRILVDKNFNKIPCEYIYPTYPRNISAPQNLKEMIKTAEKISENIDFIRVDLYSIGNKIYFGELTVYPENGFGIFVPSKFDLIFGEYWDIKY